MWTISLFILATLLCSLTASQRPGSNIYTSDLFFTKDWYDVEQKTADKLALHPHDATCFTQGLQFVNSELFVESCGLYGRSELRLVHVRSNQVVKRQKLPSQYFAEGLTIVEDKILLLTWREKKMLWYSLSDLTLLKSAPFHHEGYGLAYNSVDRVLYATNSTHFVNHFSVDAVEMTVDFQRAVPVVDSSSNPVRSLNELEYIHPYLWANVWQKDEILLIKPDTGKVTHLINMSPFYKALDLRYTGREDVLNGIALFSSRPADSTNETDPEQFYVYMTGKLWSTAIIAPLPRSVYSSSDIELLERFFRHAASTVSLHQQQLSTLRNGEVAPELDGTDGVGRVPTFASAADDILFDSLRVPVSLQQLRSTRLSATATINNRNNNNNYKKNDTYDENNKETNSSSTSAPVQTVNRIVHEMDTASVSNSSSSASNQEEKYHSLRIMAQLCGFGYVIAWAVSFYPQLIMNLRRQSVVGYSLDLVVYNVSGFVYYLVFTVVMYSVEVTYDLPKAVESSDVIFSIHSFILCLAFTYQAIFYERGNQKVSYLCWFLTALGVIVIVVLCIMAGTGDVAWHPLSDMVKDPTSSPTQFSVVGTMGMIKALMTFIKYAPQVYLNYKNKSTDGLSISQYILDFTGGTLALLENFLNAINYGSWTYLSGNVPKLLISIASISYDLVIYFQHVVLYKKQNNISQTNHYNTNHQSTRDIVSTIRSFDATSKVTTVMGMSVNNNDDEEDDSFHYSEKDTVHLTHEAVINNNNDSNNNNNMHRSQMGGGRLARTENSLTSGASHSRPTIQAFTMADPESDPASQSTSAHDGQKMFFNATDEKNGNGTKVVVYDPINLDHHDSYHDDPFHTTNELNSSHQNDSEGLTQRNEGFAESGHAEQQKQPDSGPMPLQVQFKQFQ